MQLDPNPYLAAVMRKVRAGRPMLPEDQPFYTRVEKVPAGNYVEIWFRTGGCTWDHAGGCTMCNYGFSSAVDAPGVVDSVRAALQELTDHPHELMISPSGGMWDPQEVPTAALAEIYELAAAARPARFFVETRAETINAERLQQMRSALPGVGLAVEVGLESAHDPVLVYCVNKGSGIATFLQGAATVRSHGAQMYANVSLGTAFLERGAALQDAVSTVRWALANGADTAVLFPLHIKPYTLLDFLSQRGRYEPMTLWDLVEALCLLGPELASRVEIAWYKSYYDTAKKVTTSPTGCAECHGLLLTELDRYRATLDFDVVHSLSLRRCSCAPPLVADQPPAASSEIAEKVVWHYDQLARDLDLGDSWQRWRPRLEPAIHASFERYAPQLQAAHVDR